jgi:hypothetical protein
MTVTNMSEAQALAVKSEVDTITANIIRSTRKAGLTWSMRVAMQSKAQQSAKDANYSERLAEITAILNNPTNIARWKKEAPAIAKEKQRLADIETERLRVIEEKRIEEKRLKDIEDLKLEKIRERILTNLQKSIKEKKDKEKRLLDLSIKSQELESFYELDLPRPESIPSIESIEIIPSIESIEIIPSADSVDSIDSMSKQIPLETFTPVLAVLGIGLVSYYLLKGNKK